jgi:hypothetical protein
MITLIVVALSIAALAVSGAGLIATTLNERDDSRFTQGAE